MKKRMNSMKLDLQAVVCKPIARTVYQIDFPEDLPGDWINHSKFIKVEFNGSNYIRCTKWSFPTEFYGTRRYWELMKAIGDELTKIEKEIAKSQIKSN